MSAQLRSEGAASPRLTRVQSSRPPEPGEVAFDRWLKKELGRLYDDALSEPVPDDLKALLDSPPPKPATPKDGKR